MFHLIEGGSVEIIENEGYEYRCQLPPVGYGKHRLTGELKHVGVRSVSTSQNSQIWKSHELPKNWKERRKKELIRQNADSEYFDPDLEKIRAKWWLHRLCGEWIKINGRATYIPPSFWFYLNCCPLDVGLPTYRDTDRRFYYVWEYCCDDPCSAGLVDIERRRMGKTYKSGSIGLDRTSIYANHHGSVQSKTGPDAKQVFLKTIVRFFKKLPDFFRPIYDQSKGVTPTTELRFFQTVVKGRKAEDILDAEELESWFDWVSSDIFALDGSKLGTYIMDEFGKCFAKGTKIRMYDGSIKNVEDVVEGDFVMGDDSTPRRAYGIAAGKERMYRVVPNSGQPFECNESHILSLKWANRKWNPGGWQYGQTVNISVADYFKLPANVKRHLMLWKVGVDYAEKPHEIDPYYLGVWLGDGSSYSAGFTTNDEEVLEYMQGYAATNKIRLVPTQDKYVFHLSGKTCVKGSNPILTELKQLNLLQNKHIPQEFLIDSLENRLKLLAGLVDSDGYLSVKKGKPTHIEIVQKRKELAYEICELVNSCGFKGTIKSKVATMVREDGSVYKCEVYRVNIFGELYRIPCKVKRKIAENVEFHANRRNPLRSGFRIEPIGEGEYYGFAVDKNHLFLLADYTVVHNTMECNVWDRWNVVRYCLDQDGVWCGKALLTSTIEEMESGGSAAKQIWDASNPHQRDANGRTQSGLYRFFLPSYETTLFDKFGMPRAEEAKVFYINQREGLKNDSRALSSIIRKNPFTIIEAFRIDSQTCLYDSEKLNNQLDALNWKTNVTTRGNFVWEGGVRDSKVVWEKSSRGRWEICWLFDKPEESNNIEKVGGLYKPKNHLKFVAGADTFSHDIVLDNRRSDGAMLVKMKFDATSDNPYNNAFVCMYKYRAEAASIQYEDMLKTVVYFGCQVLFERNKNNWRDYFISRGYEHFLMKLPGEPDYGLSANKNTHQQLAEVTEEYILENCEKVYFKDCLTDWLEFDINNTTKYDVAMAAGYTLIADIKKLYRRGEGQLLNLSDYGFKKTKIA